MLNKTDDYDEIITNNQIAFSVTERDVPRVTEALFYPITRKTIKTSRALLITIIIIITPIVIVGLVLGIIFGLKVGQNLHPYPTHQIGWYEGAPDGFTRQILGINGSSPQILRIKKGDRVIYDIQNMVYNETMIDTHFHGIFQNNTLTMDGVGSVTQCEPKYKKHYLYNFTTGDQVGTYWYHSHSGLNVIDGLKGVFVIEDPEDPYLSQFNTTISSNYFGNVNSSLFYVDHSSIDDDKQIDSVLHLCDWHHQLGKDLFKILMTPASEGKEPVPDSALLNGKGNYYCRPPNCTSMYNTKIVNGKAKRFRIVNTSSMALFHLTIQGHSMYVIETDGIILEEGPAIQVLRVNPGQRYSVIVKADQHPGNYWIRAIMDHNVYPSGAKPGWQPEVFGMMSYTDNLGNIISLNDPLATNFNLSDKILTQSMADAMINTDLSIPLVPMKSIYPPPPQNATKTFIINLQGVTRDDGTDYLTFNNITFNMDMTTTMLGRLLAGQDYTSVSNDIGLSLGYNPLEYVTGDVVDLIINNYDEMEHPLHGHGHAFYTMYTGVINSKEYVNAPSTNPFPYNVNATLRDVATVNGNSVMVLRFVADNPGIWAFHCHVSWHHAAGLMLTLVEDSSKIKNLYYKYKASLMNC